ncbi:nucleotidyltransferase domain-containing protein [bacterium]|nr:nucleotidyltransferase domain-containing protein [bacterium]
MKSIGTLPNEEIIRVAARYGARRVRVFGSRVRGEERPDSDLDLLVEFDQDRSLLDAIGLEQELEELLGFPVQVLTPAGLSPILRDEVLSTALPL